MAKLDAPDRKREAAFLHADLEEGSCGNHGDFGVILVQVAEELHSSRTGLNLVEEEERARRQGAPRPRVRSVRGAAN